MRTACSRALMLVAIYTVALSQSALLEARAEAEPALPAERWAKTIAAIMRGSDFVRLTSEQITARIRPLVPSAADGFIEGSSPQNGIEKINASWDTGPSRSKAMKIEITRVDPAGHEVYPILRKLLLKQFVRPVWRVYNGDSQTVWENLHDHHYAVRLNDKGNGYGLTLELEYTEQGNEENLY